MSKWDTEFSLIPTRHRLGKNGQNRTMKRTINLTWRRIMYRVMISDSYDGFSAIQEVHNYLGLLRSVR